MKKFRISAVILCLLISILFGACGGDANENTTPVSDEPVALADVLDKINEKFSLTEETMKPIEDVDSLELYYNILPDDVVQFAAETTKNAADDVTEIILVEAVDEEAARRVSEALELRYNSQRDLCASYSPENLAILNECSVVKNGNFVTLIISEYAQEITDCYDSCF